MPRDSGGVMQRTNGVFQGSTTWQQQQQSADKRIIASQQDTHDEDMAQEITDSLSRDGKGGMRNNLEMGGNRVVNVGAPQADTDALRRGDSFQVEIIQASTGVNEVMFSVPSWARELIVGLEDVESLGSTPPFIQLGTSAGWTQAGYKGSIGEYGATTASLSVSIPIVPVWNTGTLLSGRFALSLYDAVNNRWCFEGGGGYVLGSPSLSHVAGSVALASAATQIRIRASQAFDGGNIGLQIKG